MLSLNLNTLVVAPVSAFGFFNVSAFDFFNGSAFGFFSQSEIEFFIIFGFTVTSAPFLLPFVGFSLPQVRHIKVSQIKRTRELTQLVETKGLREDVRSLPIFRNINSFDFTLEDTLTNKVVVHLNVLSPGVKDGALRTLDIVEVVKVDCCRIEHLHLQILQ